MTTPTLNYTDKNRELVVLAYACAIMQDLVTDCALADEPLPKTFSEAHDSADANEYGTMFEETFMQGNAPKWSIYANSGDAFDRAVAILADAQGLVDTWLRERAAKHGS